MLNPSSDKAIQEPPIDSEDRIASSRWLSKAISAFRQFLADNAGLLLVVISQAFGSMMNAAVKRLSMLDPPISALQVILVRMVISYACGVGYLYWKDVEDPVLGPKEVRTLLVFRGIIGFFGLFGQYFALRYLSLSEVTVLIFLAPLCTAVAGALFLSEALQISQALAGVVSLVGVVLIARPPFLFKDGDTSAASVPNVLESAVTVVREANPAERMLAVGVTLTAVLGLTGAFILVRAIGKRAHTVHIMNSFAIQSFIVTTIGMIATRTPFIVIPRLEWFVLLLLVTIFGLAAQILLTMGLQREAAGRASMGMYTQIVFAIVFQSVFFHTFPSWLSLLGTCLILSSAIYVAMTKPQTAAEPSVNGYDYDRLEEAPPPKDVT